jgi:hypothetical protein
MLGAEVQNLFRVLSVLGTIVLLTAASPSMCQKWDNYLGEGYRDLNSCLTEAKSQSARKACAEPFDDAVENEIDGCHEEHGDECFSSYDTDKDKVRNLRAGLDIQETADIRFLQCLNGAATEQAADGCRRAYKSSVEALYVQCIKDAADHDDAEKDLEACRYDRVSSLGKADNTSRNATKVGDLWTTDDIVALGTAAGAPPPTHVIVAPPGTVECPNKPGNFVPIGFESFCNTI